MRYEEFSLPKWLKPGKYRVLDETAVERAYKRLGLQRDKRAPRKAARRRRGA